MPVWKTSKTSKLLRATIVTNTYRLDIYRKIATEHRIVLRRSISNKLMTVSHHLDFRATSPVNSNRKTINNHPPITIPNRHLVWIA